MIRLSPSTATALALHAIDQAWVCFAQTTPPNGGAGPIKIEGLKSAQLVPRLRAIAADNAFDMFLIGLLPTDQPLEAVGALYEQFAADHLHDLWFQPAPPILAFIEENATAALTQLLAQTHPGGLSEQAVSIEVMAQMLDVSVVTVRRMIKAEQIPYLRWGKTLRFVPRDVFASLQSQ